MKGTLMGSGGGVRAHGRLFVRALALMAFACAAIWMPSCTGNSAGGGSPASDASTLTACPSATHSPGTCYYVLPTEAGASAAGANADRPSIVLAPDANATPRHQFVLFVNGTGGHPKTQLYYQVNFYATAANLGYAVLSVSYRSDVSVVELCTPDAGQSPVDGCYFPSRESLILGVFKKGAASALANVRVDESIAGRALLTLRYLAAAGPAGRWDEYFTSGDPGAQPGTQLVWNKIVVAVIRRAAVTRRRWGSCFTLHA